MINKKVCTIIFATLVFLNFSSKAQNRVVLYEVFTSNTCTPCKGASDNLEAMMAKYPGGVAAIEYHMNAPAPFTDPMYWADPNNIQSRWTFNSSPSGIPTMIVNGRVYSSYVAAMDEINKHLETPAPFSMLTTNRLSANKDSIYTETTIEALENITGNLRLHFDVVEMEVNGSYGATNGQTHYTWVHRQFLPTVEGITLPSSIMKGTKLTFESSWKIGSAYNVDQLAVVSFIQDIDSKQVHQATSPELPKQNIDIHMMDLKSFPVTTCSGFNCKVQFFNRGAINLTSANVNIKIGDNPAKVIPWTGNIPFGSFSEISSDDFGTPTYSAPSSTNNVTAWLTDINGSSSNSDNIIRTFKTADEISGALQLTINTDSKPEDITWQLLNNNRVVVASGGPYATVGKYKIPINLPSFDCYSLELHDAGNDGMGAAGYVKLEEMANGVAVKVIFNENVRNDGFSYKFTLSDIVTDLNEIHTESGITLFPNPTSGSVKIISDIDLTGIDITLTDPSGAQVMKGSFSNLTKDGVLDISAIQSGIYILNLNGKKLNKTTKLIISR